MRRLRFLLIVPLCGLALFGVANGVARAAQEVRNISGSFESSETLDRGMIVSLTDDSAKKVEATNTNNAARVLGVVVDTSDSLVAVDPGANKTQVATNGTATVMVTDVNGDIEAGDRIGASPFTGMGMKAYGRGYIVGSALNGFSSKSTGATRQDVTDKDGESKTISIGYIQTRLSPGFDETNPDQGVNGVQQYIRSLTGKVVSMPRIIISTVVALVTLIGVGVLLYASIYGSIVSIGRNPLARHSILAALTQSLIMILVAVTLAAVLIVLLLR